MCALSVWALLNPASPSSSRASQVVAVVPMSARGSAAVPPTLAASSEADSTTVATGVLPQHWPAPIVEPAERSPFAITQPPAPKPAVAAVVATQPPPPPLPVSDYRFWGRLFVVGDRPLTYIARGEIGAPVAAEVGTRLEDGWSVESVNGNAIVLVHAATQQRSALPIPLHGATDLQR